jgi:hypothetical protein
LFTSSKPFSSSKTKLAKSSHPNTELVVIIIVNNKEHLLRAIADTGVISSSSIVLGANISVPLIEKDDSNANTWSTMGGKFITTKLGNACDIFTPRVQSQESNLFFLAIYCI